MSEYDPQAVLFAVFDRLRGQNFSLGIGELLVALRAIEGGWGTDGPEALRKVARLLWCHSPQQAEDFDEIYSAVLALSARPAQETGPRELPSDRPPLSTPEPLVESPPIGSTPEALALPTELAPLPVRTPSHLPSSEPGPELRLYWPLSRRSMVYAWRYLRRPIKDGPRNVLDVAATVEQTARQGFFLHPVYDRRQQNDAHLVLLIDQGGSMVPFHRFTRDLVETACDEEESRIRQVEVAYFQNVPPPQVFRDPYLTEPVSLEKMFAGFTTDTSVLLVSDAGAARGYRRPERIRATAEFLVRLKRHAPRLAWLNPMPQSRWTSTSAQFIARLAPMFQMDRAGFSNAIDVLQGQLPHKRR